jgi:hypothetical protein
MSWITASLGHSRSYRRQGPPGGFEVLFPEACQVAGPGGGANPIEQLAIRAEPLGSLIERQGVARSRAAETVHEHAEEIALGLH